MRQDLIKAEDKVSPIKPEDNVVVTNQHPANGQEVNEQEIKNESKESFDDEEDE